MSTPHTQQPHSTQKLALAVTFFALALIVLAYVSFIRLPHAIATFSVFDGAGITIETDRWGGEGSPVYYRITEDGQTVVPLTFFDTLGSTPPRYSTLTDGRFLIGVFDEHEPGLLLVMHDFATGETWPRRSYADTGQYAEKRGRHMLSVLQAANPTTKLSLLIARSKPLHVK